MAVGMGIHGEPGIDETDIPTADGLAELLVAKLLTEIPEGVASEGARVVPILNGLGSVKYEELFVVYRRVAQLLAEAGLEAVDPQVGELVTSFDMAGTSLTLFWLDDELETLWNAPADAPAFRRGAVTAAALEAGDVTVEADVEPSIPEASAESRAGAARVLAALGAAKAVVDANADELGRIDAIAGDGDHGIGMERASAPPSTQQLTPSPAVQEPQPPSTSPPTPGRTRRAAPPVPSGEWPCAPSVTPWVTSKRPTPMPSPPE